MAWVVKRSSLLHVITSRECPKSHFFNCSQVLPPPRSSWNSDIYLTTFYVTCAWRYWGKCSYLRLSRDQKPCWVPRKAHRPFPAEPHFVSSLPRQWPRGNSHLVRKSCMHFLFDDAIIRCRRGHLRDISGLCFRSTFIIWRVCHCIGFIIYVIK